MKQTNLGCKSNFPKSCLRKNHETLSNAFIMSSLRMQLWPRAFLLMDPTSSCAKRMFSAMSRPGTKADCSGEMRAYKSTRNLLARTLVKTLLATVHKLIGRKFAKEEGFDFFGIKTMRVLMPFGIGVPTMKSLVACRTSSMIISQQ